jgi:Ca2+-binding EF-hand superfamily protein
MSMAPYGVLDQLFAYFAKGSTLDFEGFINTVNLIRAKKIEDKIELILKLMDKNENGLLSFDEIVNRCNVMLNGMLERDNTDLSLEKISDYITR